MKQGPRTYYTASQRVSFGSGHARLESTVRYVGIEVGDAQETAEQSEV
jgi:hypothetical protein